ncbi:hypothetical protein NDU88_013320 [Pleurodeles waltl]|uniref:Uncharacterized protein n=1 Tax=Pleurodeles waltl TaxID=8319 RepID=A0AAV7R8E5_PLEWA|nr:hypothetical protein NDU88_013320 [Pleurodeles waltl]
MEGGEGGRGGWRAARSLGTVHNESVWLRGGERGTAHAHDDAVTCTGGQDTSSRCERRHRARTPTAPRAPREPPPAPARATAPSRDPPPAAVMFRAAPRAGPGRQRRSAGMKGGRARERGGGTRGSALATERSRTGPTLAGARAAAPPLAPRSALGFDRSLQSGQQRAA